MDKRLQMMSFRVWLFCWVFALTNCARVNANDERLSTSFHRIVSLSLCADQMLLTLADQNSIAALSYLSQDERYSLLHESAKNSRVHHGRIEEIVALKPDLVIGDGYERSLLGSQLSRLGVLVRYVTPAYRVQEVDRYLAEFSAVLGDSKKAGDVRKKFSHELAALQQDDNNPQGTLAILAPNGYMPGIQSLKNDVAHLAGWNTVADMLKKQYDFVISLEELLSVQTNWIIREELSDRHSSQAQRFLLHPIMQKTATTISDDIALNRWLCGGPWLLELAAELRQRGVRP